jgi:hypothetical protein
MHKSTRPTLPDPNTGEIAYVEIDVLDIDDSLLIDGRLYKVASVTYAYVSVLMGDTTVFVGEEQALACYKSAAVANKHFNPGETFHCEDGTIITVEKGYPGRILITVTKPDFIRYSNLPLTYQDVISHEQLVSLYSKSREAKSHGH